MTENLLEASVRANLERRRAESGGSGAGTGYSYPDGALSSPRRELAVEDLRIIAERHFAEGVEGGYKDGYNVGRGHGKALAERDQRREHADLVLSMSAAVVSRLDYLATALGVLEGMQVGKDKRTKVELRRALAAGLTELQAEVAVVGVKVAEGAF